jgi:hypothetical protein
MVARGRGFFATARLNAVAETFSGLRRTWMGEDSDKVLGGCVDGRCDLAIEPFANPIALHRRLRPINFSRGQRRKLRSSCPSLLTRALYSRQGANAWPEQTLRQPAQLPRACRLAGRIQHPE